MTAIKGNTLKTDLKNSAAGLRLREKLFQVEQSRKTGTPDKDARQFGREMRERFSIAN